MNELRPEVVDDLALCIIEAGFAHLENQAAATEMTEAGKAFERELVAARKKLLAALAPTQGA